MPKLTASPKAKFSDWHRAIQTPGTPEEGYLDSGLWTLLNYVYTKDSHETEGDPRKKLPVKDKDYLKIIFLYMLACPVLAIPKSRQMMVSWAVAAFDVWSAMRAPYREVIYQTKKEEDAHAMVTEGRKNPRAGRMDFIVQHLPGWLADPHVMGGGGNRVGELVFSPDSIDKNGVAIPWAGSNIRAVPGGADQVRGKTASKFTFDEAAFHDDFAEAWAAVRPAVTGGGTVCAISSVYSGSDFNTMVLESENGLMPEHEVHPVVQLALDRRGMEWPKGMKSWQTPSGTWVLQVHYTADPEKDPDRDGMEWFAEAARGYPGGIESPKWKREMEIDYEAGGGLPVFPFLQNPLSPVFIDRMDPQRVMNAMNVFAGYDYGTNNPSAFIVWGIDERGRLYALWELYEPCLDYRQHANRIKMCPYYEKLEYIAADNKIFSKTQQTANGLKAVAELFFEEKVYFTPARQGVDYPIAMRFLGDYWATPEEPTAFITSECPNLRNEVRGLKFQEHLSGAVASRKSNPEKLVDKNNHAWDASAYAIDRKPSRYRPALSEIEDITVDGFLKRVGVSGMSRPAAPARKRGITIVGSAH